MLRYSLGNHTQHTVYEGECTDTLLAVRPIAREWNVRTATICIDNQAAIKATKLIKPASGHYILDVFHQSLELLRGKHPGIQLTIRWTPGHEGIVWNERADEEAKIAVTEGSSPTNELPELLRKDLPLSKATKKQAYGKKLKQRAQKEWLESPRCRHMKRTALTSPTNRHLMLIDNRRTETRQHTHAATYSTRTTSQTPTPYR